MTFHPEKMFDAETWIDAFTDPVVIFFGGIFVILFVIYKFGTNWIENQFKERNRLLDERRNKPFDPNDKTFGHPIPGYEHVGNYKWFYYKGQYYQTGTIMIMDIERVAEFEEAAGVGKTFRRKWQGSDIAEFIHTTADGGIAVCKLYQGENGVYRHSEIYWKFYFPEELCIKEIVKPVMVPEEGKEDFLRELTSTTDLKPLKSIMLARFWNNAIICAILVFVFAAVGAGLVAWIIAAVYLIMYIFIMFSL